MYSIEEAKKLRLDFWEKFGKRCEIHPLLKGKRKKWLLHRTKIKGVVLRFEIGRKDAKVILELGHRSEDKRLQAYEILERYKTIIENGFEKGLVWEFYHQREDSGQEICRIYVLQENVDLHRQNQWPDIFNFFIENMLLLEENFLAVSDILKEELNHE
ncbi:DUF4268 domain-containing protein [Maribellus comscasis]|uniref:DUF4268 domain-containing protein n=1 Tax=Maribellus comscasis TaxID=2681766 RepID=A0A6I6K436_9BACT|nr:DUF4268 domain-containing protein [Maribellus comscasis]QGY47377.1 DUF4268 domain-containing protein [Maribellus comscasis]